MSKEFDLNKKEKKFLLITLRKLTKTDFIPLDKNEVKMLKIIIIKMGEKLK